MGLLILASFGTIILYSAANQQFGLVIKQFIHFGFALVLMIVLAQIPPMVYKRWAIWLYGLGLFLLLIVLIIGHISKGGQRWIHLGFFRFQPSEFMKISIPIFIAWYFCKKSPPPSFKEITTCFVITLIPVALTLKQPDLGTAILLGISGGTALLLAGISWRYLVTALAALAAASPVFWHFMHDYQRKRILTFLNPSHDPLGAGYNIIQSKIAIGSGGLWGKGWLLGTQSHLHFLPAHTTDFIFAVCGEEFGFVGCFILFALYIFVVGRCFYITYNAQNTYTRLLAGTLTLTFFMGVLINIGMVSGLLPVVGIPLPLVSYGGSSLIATFAGFGILMSIHGHRSLIDA
jgi:rod shape determining protein RodA